MNEHLFKIIESLMSKNVNEDYVNMYLNDPELRIKCDEMISNILDEEFSNKVYNIDKCLNFLNNVVSKQIKEKPYLLGLNIIIKTIYSRIDKNKDTMYYLNSDQKKELSEQVFCLTNMLMIISDEFTLKNQIDSKSEYKMSNYYMDKINNSISLSKEEVEEMVSFYLTSNYTWDYLDAAMDYALKNIIEQDLRIDDFLYKKVFIHVCEKQLLNKDIDLNEIRFIFLHEKDLSYEMLFNPNTNTIFINNDAFKKRSVIQNFFAFFHELRHYDQNNKMEESIESFLSAKDLYLVNNLGKEYYSKNYKKLFFEKNANFESYKDTYDFIKEKAPMALEKVKRNIYIDLMPYMSIDELDICKRDINGKEEDLNLIFDKTLKEKKNFMYEILGNGIKNSLLIEYNLTSEKRSVFELLEGKEFATNKGITSRIEIYNYLLYGEIVSLEYIKRNFELLDLKDNQERYGKYYDEARKVLQNMLINYRINLFSKKSKLALKEGKVSAFNHYNLLVEGLKKSKLSTLNIDKAKLYIQKEDELSSCYKWLYDLLKEFKNENISQINNKSK